MMEESSTAKKRPQIKWTEERKDYLRQRYATMQLSTLTAAFNEHFGLSVTAGAVGQAIHGMGLRKKTLKSPLS